MSYVTSALDFIDNPSVARSIVFGLLGSMGITQFVKFLFPTWIPDFTHRAITMFMAFFVAFIVSISSWPKDQSAALAVSLMTGVISPLAYKAATAALYHYFPWIEPYLSARPRTQA